MKRGFTLIELLIVVAIIAILAAIAVPNFLEAQTRSKVSRVKADQRTLATALEAYCVDQNSYPTGRTNGLGDGAYSLEVLTKPIPYLTVAASEDPFISGATSAKDEGGTSLDAYFNTRVHCYFYFSYAKNSPWATHPAVQGDITNIHADWSYKAGWNVDSIGPDRVMNHTAWTPIMLSAPGYEADGIRRIYDPTNGTISSGDIGRFGGAVGVKGL